MEGLEEVASTVPRKQGIRVRPRSRHRPLRTATAGAARANPRGNAATINQPWPSKATPTPRGQASRPSPRTPPGAASALAGRPRLRPARYTTGRDPPLAPGRRATPVPHSLPRRVVAAALTRPGPAVTPFPPNFPHPGKAGFPPSHHRRHGLRVEPDAPPPALTSRSVGSPALRRAPNRRNRPVIPGPRAPLSPRRRAINQI